MGRVSELRESSATCLLDVRRIGECRVLVPSLGSRDILVKMLTASICMTDYEIYVGDVKTAKLPIVLGHEGVGRVVAIGERVSSVSVGDVVLIDPNIYDNTCSLCRIGKTNLCTSGGLMGRDDDGLFREYLVVDETRVYKLPPSVDSTIAPLIQPLSTVVHAQSLIEVKPGDKVAILGSGVTGLMHMQLAKLHGAQTIIITRNPFKARIAEKLGADMVLERDVAAAIKDVKEIFGGGADIVIEAIGAPAAVEAAIKMIRPGGTILLYGISTRDASINIYYAYFNEIKIQASRSSTTRDFIKAIDLVSRGKVDLKPYVTKVYTSRELIKAFEELELDKGKLLRHIITF